MLFIGKKNIIAIYHGNKAISAIYRNGKLLWQAVRSCFGSGMWRNDKPWLNDEGWKNNKKF